MKLRGILFVAILGLVVPAWAGISPIRLDVEQASKVKDKGPAASTRTRIRSLTMKLSNNSNESFDHLVVRYWFFARPMKGHDLKIFKTGERKASLAPRGRAVVESETVSATFTEEHVEVKMRTTKSSRVSGDRQAKPEFKKVPASGEKLAGYAVQVRQGGNVVAEYYSEEGYREFLARKGKGAAR